MKTRKTYSEQFMELETSEQKSKFVSMNVDEWCKELDAQIEKSRRKSEHFEAWINLYELNPRLALKYRHLGIIKKL